MVVRVVKKGFGPVAACLLALLFSAGRAFALPQQPTGEAVPGQFLVKFRKGSTADATLRRGLNVQLARRLPLTGAQLVTSPQLNDTYAKELLASGEAEYIEPNYVVHAFGIPNDPRVGEQWGMNNTGASGGTADVDIDAPEAWNVTTGSPDVVVGVVDTGVDYTHPDLAANIWKNPGEVPGNGIDDDGDGVVDDAYGFNAIAQSGDPMDDNNHGTHVAGVIGAASNNAAGVAGVNWRVKIMPLKFLDAGGSGTVDAAISAIQYAVTMKNRGVNVRVLSNSWGGSGYSQALQDAITAAENAGILFVAAAGNNGTDNDSTPQYPASYDNPNVVSVAAIDRNGNLASFSNFGQSTVHLAAPGKDILSTVRGGGYASYSGTSMATPHVSGVAALLAGREASLTADQIKDRLLSTVKPLPGLNGLVVAPGTVDAFNALTSAFAPLPPGPLPVLYERSAPAFSFDPVFGDRVIAADDGYVIHDLGFTFRYYGTDYRRVVVSANGRILPVGESDGVPASPDYSNRLFPGINVFSDDLAPSPPSLSPTGGTWFKSDGNVATITWDVVPYAARDTTDPARRLVVQATLGADGGIQFRYQDTDTDEPNSRFGKSATVGIAPAAGGVGPKVLVSDNTENPALLGPGRAVGFAVPVVNAASDFDGDGASDIAVWRPATGMWFVLPSSTGYAFERHFYRQLGLSGDTPVSGKYDGDNRTDMAVFRPRTGEWFFRYSTQNFDGAYATIQWGLPGDIPVPGDYDGDRRTDVAVFRPRDGNYYVLKSSGAFNRASALKGNTAALLRVRVSGPANHPVVADFTGAGRDSFMTVWAPVRFWTLKDGNGALVYSLPWGVPGDFPMGCQFNREKDDLADRVVVRTHPDGTLTWYTALSDGLGQVEGFGSITDIPLCRQFGGDKNDDKTVFRVWTGEWFIQPSGTKSVLRYSFGLPGDIPV